MVLGSGSSTTKAIRYLTVSRQMPPLSLKELQSQLHRHFRKSWPDGETKELSDLRWKEDPALPTSGVSNPEVIPDSTGNGVRLT